MKCPKCNSEEIDAMTPRTVYDCGSSDYDQRPNTFVQSDECKLKLTQDEKTICEYSGLPSVTSYIETKETLYTEEQLKLAYMQGYNRGVQGNPNHMESYIQFLKQSK